MRNGTLFILRPTTGQVRHKAFLKVGPDAGPQPTRVQQNPKISSAPSAPTKGGTPRHQETNNKQLVKQMDIPIHVHR